MVASLVTFRANQPLDRVAISALGRPDVLLFNVAGAQARAVIDGDARQAAVEVAFQLGSGVLDRIQVRDLARHELASQVPAMFEAPELVAHEGSCFQDLVGARELSGFDRTRAFRAMPRLQQRLHVFAGLPARLESPAIRELGLRVLVTAARRATLAPRHGRGPESIRALAVSALLAHAHGLALADVARDFRVSVRSVERIAHIGARAADVRATERRLAIAVTWANVGNRALPA